MSRTLMRNILGITLCLLATACSNGLTSCDEYASDYSCSYVENEAEYEVWYWRNLESDNGADELLIGRAKGLKMCERNAQAFASAIGEIYNSRAYICILMDDGKRMEKHRWLDI